MKLVSNETTKCPYCGCDTVISESVEMDSFGKVWQHCNGGKLEHRRFACGFESVFEPNFNKTEEARSSLCIRNNDYMQIEKVSKEIAVSVINLIDTMHCSREIKDKVCNKLKFFL